MTAWRLTFERTLAAWIGLVERFNIWIILLVLAGAAFSFHYTAGNLRMNTSTRDMLSPDLPWRQNDLKYDENFPQYTDNILVVIESGTPDEAADAANLLYNRLSEETTLFNTVYYPRALPYFRQSALLFLDTGELQDLADNLAAIQPFLSKLTTDPSLRGLFAMLTEAVKAKRDGDDIDLSDLLDRINRAFSALDSGQPYRLSWQSLMSGEDDPGMIHREFIVLQPVLDYEELFPAHAAIDRINTLARTLALTPERDIRVRLTGSAALSHDEMRNVFQGTTLAIVLALCMVGVIMLAGLGSWKLVLASLLTLITGLIYTAGFAALTVGELNLISVAFAVLYIGLGVDFAIHYCLRYRELLVERQDNHVALCNTSINIGESLLFCAVTTAMGFYAFIPTDYVGVAELGWISGSGMFISLLITLTLLPALLSLFPLDAKHRQGNPVITAIPESLINAPLIHAGRIRLMTVILAAVSLILITGISFDHNTLNLQSRKNESVKTYLELLADSETSPWTSVVVADSREEAEQLVGRLSRLDRVEKVAWIDDFVPDGQDEKLAIIEEMNLMLGFFNTAETAPPDDRQRIAALEEFNRELASLPAAETPDTGARPLQVHLTRFLERLEASDQDTRRELLRKIEWILLASLPGRLEELRTALQAEPVSRYSLPEEFKSHWLSGNNHYLIEIYPKENLMDNHALRRFVKQLQAEVPTVTGSPVVSLEAGDAVVTAFQQAFFYAFTVIALFLLAVHRLRNTLLILTPLLLATLFTGAASVIFNIPLNFANIIALPLLLGIGVDSGIHIMHRVRSKPPEDGRLLATSSARAVVVSALTTIFSIGNLSFSPHLGTASMGKLLTIGITMTLICTLIVLPSLLAGQLKQATAP